MSHLNRTVVRLGNGDVNVGVTRQHQWIVKLKTGKSLKKCFARFFNLDFGLLSSIIAFTYFIGVCR